MTNSDSDGLFENDWEDRSELAWTEADWQKYLGEQERAVQEYLRHYDQLPATLDRVDEAARRMGWDLAEDADESEAYAGKEEDDELFDDEWDPYTVHRNPVYISTQAIHLSLLAHWERVAAQPGAVSAALAVAVQSRFYRGHEQALQAVQALEMGDYILAVCLFKKALHELNLTLARLNEADVAASPATIRFREYALPRLFDLREIWLRVMNECRQSASGGDAASD
jgi:hypothetical protein